MRQRTGMVRYKVYDADYDVSVAAVRAALGDSDFESAWAEGSALSAEQAIAYAQRGRGERKRPTSGWASLTPAERDVVRLGGEGLANKDIATRLFVSPRTVQTSTGTPTTLPHPNRCSVHEFRCAPTSIQSSRPRLQGLRRWRAFGCRQAGQAG